MPPTVVLQIIKTSWTKESRGGRGATLRNAVPLALPLDAEKGKFTAQTHQFGESNDFAAPIPARIGIADREVRSIEADFVFKWSDVSCGLTSDAQTWFLRYWNDRGGAPNASFFDGPGNLRLKQPELTVASDSWVRLRWMRRFTDYDHGLWWYEHTVVNFAVFDGAIEPDLFLRGAPTQQWVSLPILR